MKRVLVTGATGVVGSAVAPMFLNEPDTELWLLLRARDEAELEARVEQLFAYWGADIATSTARSRVRALRGDVSAPMLGLDPGDWKQLCNRLTHIVHSAASVRLDLSLDEARQSAVTPVREIIELARQCASGGQLEKIEYVSTIGVAGRLPGGVPEAPLEAVPGYHNTYEHAKAEAENLILSEVRAGLPVTVHRPSMVVGHSQTGQVIRFQVFYFLSEFLSGARTWGVVPQLDDLSLDIVPCDFVGRAIHASSQSRDAGGRILHLCAGPQGALPLSEIAGIARKVMSDSGRDVPMLKPVPLAVFHALWRVLQDPAGPEWRRRLAKLAPFFTYASDRQSFENERSIEFLASLGVTLPDPRALCEVVLRHRYEAATREAGRSALMRNALRTG